MEHATLLLPLAQIIWLDLLLSGDNAIVIALACRELPARQRKLGMALGAGTAIVLRIVFALFITYLLGVPYLKVLGGVLLIWIGIKLTLGEEDAGSEVASSDKLWRAVRTIAIADAVMSLDNVVAIAAAAGGTIWLFVFGLLLSIPLIVFGSSVLSSVMTRFPVIIWAGGALLGWIAGDMIVSDPAVMNLLSKIDPALLATQTVSDGHGRLVSQLRPIASVQYGAQTIGAVVVLTLGMFLKHRRT